MIGSEVKNHNGNDLGDIVDIMLDAKTGDPAYAVISTGFLGFGDRYFAVPFKAFIVDARHDRIWLKISRDDFKKSPNFDREKWPGFPHKEFIKKVHDYYRLKTYWEE